MVVENSRRAATREAILFSFLGWEVVVTFFGEWCQAEKVGRQVLDVLGGRRAAGVGGWYDFTWAPFEMP